MLDVWPEAYFVHGKCRAACDGFPLMFGGSCNAPGYHFNPPFSTDADKLCNAPRDSETSDWPLGRRLAPSYQPLTRDQEQQAGPTCVALRAYAGGQRPGDLSFQEGETLDVVAGADAGGWSRARNIDGKEGYVPAAFCIARAVAG